MQEPDFWDDQKKAQSIINESNALKDMVEQFQALEEKYENAEVSYELVKEEDDEELRAELEQELEKLVEEMSEFELSLLLNGEHDSKNAILELHPGAGGTESQDWASLLLRMYTRWAERKGYKVEVLDYLPGEEAGTKRVTLQIGRA